MAGGEDIPLTPKFWKELKTGGAGDRGQTQTPETGVNSVIRPRARDDIKQQFRWYLVEQDAPDAAFNLPSSFAGYFGE